MKIRKILLGSIFVLSTFLAACGSNTEEANSEKSKNNENEKLTIYTTLYPLKDFAEKIGGNKVEVKTLIPAGGDAHTFEPTTKDLIAVAEADAFIYNGLGMEPYAEKIKKAVDSEKTLMLEASKGIDVISGAHEHTHNEESHSEAQHNHDDKSTHSEEEHSHEESSTHSEEDHNHDEKGTHSEKEHSHEEEHDHHHDHGDNDPHVWLDPYKSITLAENIKNALIELSPDDKKTFNKNFEELNTNLEKLDHEFHKLVEGKENPEIVVSHAAYGYWEQSFGIQQIPVTGLSPTDEPSQKELQEIIEIAKEHKIKYILFEQNVTPKVAEVIRKEINADPLRLHNLSVLTEEDIKNEEDYFSLMRQNIETLEKALEKK
ncbi:zinc transport system substrate-binding protein [Bacillus pakistanensis]|uniref:Zinc transport system substrate-binding protein n=1 Tax=Rossellomorea pakistanensis TaxID=992288 RepID=A0ABS2NGS5_9BACI|nr:zinc ABC transporter substrate-binding protein [Bacillus pakistanensis]MBM7587037.1 zinc transport system substrate-binding protein [Bacillus pakistanensis]